MRTRLTLLHAAAAAFAAGVLLLAACAPRPAAPSSTPSSQPPASSEVTTATGGVAPGENIPFSALDLDIVFRQVQSMEAGGIPIENTLEAKGRVRLTVDAAVSPATVRGEGALPVTGNGHMGGVAFTNSGTIAYRFEGVIARGAGGALELRLRGQRSTKVQTRPVGPSASTPFEDFQEQTLVAEDGYVHEWTWEQSGSGITGSEAWTLRIPSGQ